MSDTDKGKIVSIIVPCFNEEETIKNLLSGIYTQTFPRNLIQVIIADGLSTDRTREEINYFIQEHKDLEILVVDNPRRIIPAGLNVCLEQADGEYIIRLDAHSIPAEDYIEKCVNHLAEGSGENVGGVWDLTPPNNSWIARSIAQAGKLPVAIGDAYYRFTDKSGEVDTVPFGAFRKTIFERVGYFNELLLTNEDYEFNTRIRAEGGKIWLDPEIRSKYFTRSNFSKLASQYWRYGYWKYKMLRSNPLSIKWRQILPPLYVFSLIILGLLSLFVPLMRILLGLQVSFYVLSLLITGIYTATKEKDFGMLLGVPIAIAIMHVCWGAGALASIIYSPFDKYV